MVCYLWTHITVYWIGIPVLMKNHHFNFIWTFHFWFKNKQNLPYHGPRSGRAMPRRRNSCMQSVRSSIGNGSILALATTLTKYSTKCVLLRDSMGNWFVGRWGERIILKSRLGEVNSRKEKKKRERKENKQLVQFCDTLIISRWKMELQIFGSWRKIYGRGGRRFAARLITVSKSSVDKIGIDSNMCSRMSEHKYSM